MAVSQCRHRNEEESLESKETCVQQQLKEEATASHSVEEYLKKHYEVTRKTDRQTDTQTKIPMPIRSFGLHSSPPRSVCLLICTQLAFGL